MHCFSLNLARYIVRHTLYVQVLQGISLNIVDKPLTDVKGNVLPLQLFIYQHSLETMQQKETKNRTYVCMSHKFSGENESK